MKTNPGVLMMAGGITACMAAFMFFGHPDGHQPAVVFEAPISFHVVEVKQMGEDHPKPRTMFLTTERPILVIEGAGVVGKEIFVELRLNDQRLTISPTKIVMGGGTAFSMGHGDLPPGKYFAQLYLDGHESLATEFTMLK